MKHIFTIIIAVLLMSVTANAQSWAWGPKVGVTFSTVNGVANADVREGMTVGIFAERAVNDWLVMQADLLFTQHGYDLTSNPKVRYRADYISLPVVGKYYLIDELNFQIGGQFEYLVGAKKKVSGVGKSSVRDEFNRYNIAFIAGLGYDFDFGLMLEGRYFYGLTQMTPQDTNSRSGYLQFAVGWRF